MKNNITSFLLLTAFLLNFHFIAAQSKTFIEGEILIQLKQEVDGATFSKRHTYYRGISTGLHAEKKLSKQLNIWLFTFDDKVIGKDEIRNYLAGQKEVKAIQFNHILKHRETIPDDPQFNVQWQWRNDASTGGTVDADVDAELAWDITTGGLTALGDSIVVAVIDDGMDMDHPDLVDNLWKNYAEIPDNGIDDDGNGYIDDYNGWYPNDNNDHIENGNHGVKVSGMVGAKGNNGTGVTGINWNVKIMFVKVQSPLTESQIIEAYSYILTQRQIYNDSNGTEGAFVVSTNASWGRAGWPEDAPIWCAFYDTLGMSGILNVGATSNSNINVDVEGDLPTTCPSEFLVAVTMTNKDDAIAGSGYGVTNIDVAAPGKSIFTTGNGGNYVTNSGTSYAAPLTAGLVGLLYAAPCTNLPQMAKNTPPIAARAVRDFIYSGVDTLPHMVDSLVTGGRINAYKSLQFTLDNCGACPVAYGVEVTDITVSTAMISWYNFDATNAVDLRWRYEGDASWTTITDVTSPYQLTGLSTCHTVEFQTKAICDNSNSGFSSSIVFQTDGCCTAPENIHTTAIDETGATIAWNSLTAAQGYTIRFREAGDSDWQSFSITENTPNYDLNNLTDCSEYEVQVQTVCPGTTTDYTPSFFFSTTGCGSCLEGDYCESRGDNASGEWIERVVFADIDHTSGTDNGYGNFTGFSTELAPGDTYNFSLFIGYDINHYNENIRVWIDYNKDGVFDPVDELVIEPAVRKDTFNTTITIPDGLTSGSTRMRISLKWNQTNPSAINPCEQFSIGEVEDYCVYIKNPNDIKDLTNTGDIILLPNPVQDELTLTFPGQQLIDKLKLSIFSIRGEQLYASDDIIDWGQRTITLRHLNFLPDGIYLLLIQTNDVLLTKKFVKMGR